MITVCTDESAGVHTGCGSDCRSFRGRAGGDESLGSDAALDIVGKGCTAGREAVERMSGRRRGAWEVMRL